MLIFNDDGTIKTEVLFFKRYNPTRKEGNLINTDGLILTYGTYLDFESRRRKNIEIIEIP